MLLARINYYDGKVGCVFPMVISSDFRMGQHRDDDHQEDAPHFNLKILVFDTDIEIKNVGDLNDYSEANI